GRRWLIASFPTRRSSDLAGEVDVKGATIEPHVVFDASLGPIYVGAGSVVQAFTRVVGPCYIGCDSTVLGDRITSCSIGDHCKVRSEEHTSELQSRSDLVC